MAEDTRENSGQIRGKRGGIENLKPFKPGESGNPTGRPIGQRNYATIYREALIKLADLNGKTPEEFETEMMSKALVSARAGDYKFYKDVQDRTHGQAPQTVKFTDETNKELDQEKLEAFNKWHQEQTKLKKK